MTLPRRAEAPPSGIPTWARVGQKVVAIGKNGWQKWSWFGHWEDCAGPPEGAICTISGTRFDSREGWLLILKEWPIRTLWYRDGYAVGYFRPLITKSQDEDIAEFRKLLTGQPVRESERA